PLHRLGCDGRRSARPGIFRHSADRGLIPHSPDREDAFEENMSRTPPKISRGRDVGKIIDRTIVRLWDTIEELEALNPAELRYYRVAVFGSARVQSGDREYREVKKLACRRRER